MLGSSLINKLMAYKDKEVQAKAQRDHYQRYQTQFRTRTKIRRRARKNWLREIKSRMVCRRCPEQFHECLHFHHIDDNKDDNVTKMVNELRPIHRIVDEMRKCVVLCANCHAKTHAGLISDFTDEDFTTIDQSFILPDNEIVARWG